MQATLHWRLNHRFPGGLTLRCAVPLPRACISSPPRTLLRYITAFGWLTRYLWRCWLLGRLRTARFTRSTTPWFLHAFVQHPTYTCRHLDVPHIPTPTLRLVSSPPATLRYYGTPLPRAPAFGRRTTFFTAFYTTCCACVGPAPPPFPCTPAFTYRCHMYSAAHHHRLPTRAGNG